MNERNPRHAAPRRFRRALASVSPIVLPVALAIAVLPLDAGAGGVQVGQASWYGPGFHGKRTASGQAFDSTRLTAAHRSLPLGTKARVTNLGNGKAVEVTINDRGPHCRGRILDLSRAAAKQLAMGGTARVRVEAVP